MVLSATVHCIGRFSSFSRLISGRTLIATWMLSDMVHLPPTRGRSPEIAHLSRGLSHYFARPVVVSTHAKVPSSWMYVGKLYTAASRPREFFFIGNLTPPWFAVEFQIPRGDWLTGVVTRLRLFEFFPGDFAHRTINKQGLRRLRQEKERGLE